MCYIFVTNHNVECKKKFRFQKLRQCEVYDAISKIKL